MLHDILSKHSQGLCEIASIQNRNEVNKQNLFQARSFSPDATVFVLPAVFGGCASFVSILKSVLSDNDFLPRKIINYSPPNRARALSEVFSIPAARK